MLRRITDKQDLKPTFLFAAQGDLKVFGNSGARILIYVSVCKAVLTVVAVLSVVR